MCVLNAPTHAQIALEAFYHWTRRANPDHPQSTPEQMLQDWYWAQAALWTREHPERHVPSAFDEFDWGGLPLGGGEK